MQFSLLFGFWNGAGGARAMSIDPSAHEERGPQDDSVEDERLGVALLVVE
jgi:hypothetical protein